MNILKNISTLLTTNNLQNFQQIRNKWQNRWMIRDVKRRKMTTEYAPLRLRINSLRKNDVLPSELREIADAEIHALPRDSALIRTKKRCVITSRPRGVVYRWRLSRIVFRHLADYNKLSGVQRAMW
ncbi:28S ribosomal protein S14, mitochondrial [Diabrotica virgifera virgifera]|uniref:28S ribosomal protein S14, mitochondrial n=1 Tax=Diabrotica virgifera virgifera TaxID=50390 RepID=A0A6P7FUK8_DIAVI|nr:28S ribosomal protein S14, mitochondrial [Diabrotica virgifera virgifera]